MTKKILPFIILSVLIIFFFLRLFYPTQSLFMIPDFGESDVLHLNLPFKYILSESLKNGEWPLWTPYLANGFPLLAEGQIGTFYLPNLVFFRFLPLVWAYNLNLVLSYFLAGVGMYLFTKKIGFSAVSSFFASFIFTFSGFLAVHLNHFNLIQAASLLPLIFWSGVLIWQKPSLKYCVLFAFFLSQQIFTGHFYIVFITLVGVFIFLSIYSLLSTKFTSRCILSLLLSLIFGVALSAIQLLPTIELWQLSARQGGLDFNTVTDYPYPFRHLITFISPYFFGNPALGTYPSFSTHWGIFWENTAYVGIIPLLLVFSCLFFLKNKLVRTFLFMLFISMLLVLGRNSPLYFIFTFFPFSLFRVPSKFLLLVTFSISILAAISFESIKSQIHAIARICDKEKLYSLFILAIFLFLLIDGYRFSYNYPPTTPAQWWTEAPEITQLIPANSKIASPTAPYLWNKVFKTDGWQDIKPYVYFNNSLYPNYNVLSSIRQSDINTGGLIPRRLSLFSSIVKTIEVDEDKKEASVSSSIVNALNLASVEYLVTPHEINSTYLILKDKIISPNFELDPFYIYKIRNSFPRSYLAFNTKKIETIEDFNNILSEKDFAKKGVALVENDLLKLENYGIPIKPININFESSTRITLDVFSDFPAILILTDTNYPGWKAYVDEKETGIHNTNLVQRGVRLPGGEHKVEFVFEPDSFELGKKVTVYSWLIISAAVFLSLFVSARKSSETPKI